MPSDDGRIRTSLELSPENLEFWKRLPQGEGKRLINFLLDEVRFKFKTEGIDSIHVFLGKVEQRAWKIL